MELLSRRNVLRAGLVGAGAAVISRDMPAEATGRVTHHTFDIAWLGQTTRVLPMPPMNPAGLDVPGTFRGWAVYMEGSIYEKDTIPGKPGEPQHDFDPKLAPAGTFLGTCFGWGFVVEDFDRSPSTDPTLILTVQHVFGKIVPENLFPPDQLVSSGLEFAHLDEKQPPPARKSQPATHPVTGGSGKYAGANGVVVKEYIGTNKTSALWDKGAGHGARNYRATFAISTGS